MTAPLRIGLAGLGTVGAGLVTLLQTHGPLLAARAGRPIELVAVSARSRTRDRGVELSDFEWEDDPVALAGREDIDLLVEVMGGEDGPAKVATEAALGGGRHVVTANKAMMARHGTALAALAEEHGAALRFEAAVAGGIPIVKALAEGMAANSVHRVLGVMNGTCNYILTQMEKTGGSYDDILAEAQLLGYAESDPAFDVGGQDAAQKLALLAAIAFGAHVDYDGMTIEGIEKITLTDIRYAADLGYKIKLLGVAGTTGTETESRMQPCLVPAESPLGQLDGVSNMVVLEGDFVGRTVYQGPGAGAGPTASAVMADIIDIARGLTGPAFGRPAASLAESHISGAPTEAQYYLRMTLADRPGSFAQVADALGRAGISIDRMRQTRHESDAAPVLIITHACARHDMEKAMQRITALEVSTETPVAYRIENI